MLSGNTNTAGGSLPRFCSPQMDNRTDQPFRSPICWQCVHQGPKLRCLIVILIIHVHYVLEEKAAPLYKAVQCGRLTKHIFQRCKMRPLEKEIYHHCFFTAQSNEDHSTLSLRLRLYSNVLNTVHITLTNIRATIWKAALCQEKNNDALSFRRYGWFFLRFVSQQTKRTAY